MVGCCTSEIKLFTRAELISQFFSSIYHLGGIFQPTSSKCIITRKHLAAIFTYSFLVRLLLLMSYKTGTRFDNVCNRVKHLYRYHNIIYRLDRRPCLPSRINICVKLRRRWWVKMYMTGTGSPRRWYHSASWRYQHSRPFKRVIFSTRVFSIWHFQAG